jgi:hypothetical protein
MERILPERKHPLEFVTPDDNGANLQARSVALSSHVGILHTFLGGSDQDDKFLQASFSRLSRLK